MGNKVGTKINKFAVFEVDKYENYALKSWWDCYEQVEGVYKSFKKNYPEKRYVILKIVTDTEV